MAFSGTVDSDFLKLVQTQEQVKETLIDYSANDFLTLKTRLVEYIKAVYPLDYNRFVESDLGIMLLELVAYMGAVASLKSDMLANENFLRTARNRNNIKNLLELVGVKLKGPISAAANAKLTFETPPATSPTQELSVSSQNRVVQIVSDVDGGSLNFTLYKVVNGLLEDLDGNTSISLTEDEASNFTSSGTGSVFENLVLLEGALVIEQGTFAGSEAIKSIQLQESPVVEGSVQVFISGTGSDTSGAYTQVDNVFFASGANSKVFQVQTDDDFRATVIFGDNNLGLSPRVGDEYLVMYRVGGGERGNIASEVINVQVPVLNTDSSELVNATLENSSKGTGGADAESITKAKRYAPLTFRRQDRLVTLQDFKTFGNSFYSSYGSVGKVTATTTRAYSSANYINVFVLEKASNLQLRKSTPQFKELLLTAMNQKKMLTDEIVIVDGLIRTMDLNVTLRVNRELLPNSEQIKSKAREIIQNYFNVDNTDFGQEFLPDNLARALNDIPEITYATIDNFPQPVQIDHNEIIQLNNFSINVIRV